MKDYIVLEANNSPTLADKVKQFWEKGWELQGGISVSLSESDDYQYTIYAQAMVKREPQGEMP